MGFIYPIAGNFGLSVEGTPEVEHVIDVDDIVAFLSTDDITIDEDAIGDLIDEVFAQFIADTGQPIEQDTAYALEFDGTHATTFTPSLAKVNGISLLEYRSGFDWYTIDADTYAP